MGQVLGDATGWAGTGGSGGFAVCLSVYLAEEVFSKPPSRAAGSLPASSHARIVIVEGPGDPGETTPERFGEPAN